MQTAEQRSETFDQGKDGAIFCLDLDTVEGQAALNYLKEQSPDVIKAAQFRDLEDELRYMLVLMPYSVAGRAIIRLASNEALAEAVAQTWTRSMDFGDTFAIVIVPASQDIVTMFVAQDSAGTA